MFVFLEGTYSGTAFLGDEDQEDATHRQASKYAKMRTSFHTDPWQRFPVAELEELPMPPMEVFMALGWFADIADRLFFNQVGKIIPSQVVKTVQVWETLTTDLICPLWIFHLMSLHMFPILKILDPHFCAASDEPHVPSVLMCCCWCCSNFPVFVFWITPCSYALPRIILP